MHILINDNQSGEKKMSEKIQVKTTHRAAMEQIVELTQKYTTPSWVIGINEDGEPDATSDDLTRFDATVISVVFHHTTFDDPIDLQPDCCMSEQDKIDWYIDEFMDRSPSGFEKLEFFPE